MPSRLFSRRSHAVWITLTILLPSASSAATAAAEPDSTRPSDGAIRVTDLAIGAGVAFLSIFPSVVSDDVTAMQALGFCSGGGFLYALMERERRIEDSVRQLDERLRRLGEQPPAPADSGSALGLIDQSSEELAADDP